MQLPTDEALLRALRSSRLYRGRTAACRSCRSKDLRYRAPDDYRCSKCGKRISPTKGTWLDVSRLPIRKTLLLVWCFARGMPALTAGRTVGVSYPTTARAYSRIRSATLFTRWVWINPWSLRNQLSDERIVFREPGDDADTDCPRVAIAIGSDADLEVSFLQKDLAQKKTKYNVSVYSRDYLLETLYKDPESHDHASEQSGRFWKTVRRHLRKFRGISAAKLPEYLGEFALRENHAKHDLFKTLLDTLLNIPPTHVTKPVRAKNGLRKSCSTNPVSQK